MPHPDAAMLEKSVRTRRSLAPREWRQQAVPALLRMNAAHAQLVRDSGVPLETGKNVAPWIVARTPGWPRVGTPAERVMAAVLREQLVLLDRVASRRDPAGCVRLRDRRLRRNPRSPEERVYHDERDEVLWFLFFLLDNIHKAQVFLGAPAESGFAELPVAARTPDGVRAVVLGQLHALAAAAEALLSP